MEMFDRPSAATLYRYWTEIMVKDRMENCCKCLLTHIYLLQFSVIHFVKI